MRTRMHLTGLKTAGAAGIPSPTVRRSSLHASITIDAP